MTPETREFAAAGHLPFIHDLLANAGIIRVTDGEHPRRLVDDAVHARVEADPAERRVEDLQFVARHDHAGQVAFFTRHPVQRLDRAHYGQVGNELVVGVYEELCPWAINRHRLDLFHKLPEGELDKLPNSGRESSPVGRPDFKSGRGREPVLGGFDSLSLPPR